MISASNELNKNIIDMIYLIACALHNVKPDENELINLDIKQLYLTAKQHSLAAMIYMVLENTTILEKADSEIVKQWKEVKEKAIRKNIMLDAERKQIFDEMEKRHIWYMPLKGSVLKYLYPREGMREMADNDILYDSASQKEVNSIFRARGYKVVSYARGNHDVYEKPPVYNYEMHTALFSDYVYPKLDAIYNKINEKLICDDGVSYGRHLSNEDFYVYVTTHTYKHYAHAGTGLRTLADFYVMCLKFENSMNWQYISEQLKIIGISDYENSCRNLVNHLFDKVEKTDLSKLSVDELCILTRCSFSGTYGTQKNSIKRQLQEINLGDGHFSRWSKIRYCLIRLFPGREWCKRPYPFFYRHPIFIPCLWIYRMVLAIFINRKRIHNEINIVYNITNVND